MSLSFIMSTFSLFQVMNITGPDCEKILRKELGSSNFRLTDHEIVKIGSFLGFLGEYYQIKINYEFEGKNESSSYFAKSLPSNEVEREIQRGNGFHAKEIKLYAEVFPKTALPNDDWCPKFLLAKDDTLVLENLAVKGYKTLPFRFEFSDSHLEVALTTLAKFHSRSFIYEKRNPEKKIREEFSEVLFDLGFNSSNPWLQNGFRVIGQVAEKIGCFEKFDIRDELQEKLGEFFKRMYKPESDIVKVLSHSDAWKNNLMFSFDGTLEKPLHCMLLDFQIAKCIPLPIDVLLLIYLNTRRKFREKSLQLHLSFYFEKLKEELNKHTIDIEQIVGYQQFMDSCSYFNLVAIIFKSISTMVHCFPTEMFTNMTTAEYDQFMNNDRYAFVSDLMDSDVDYFERVTEAVEELVEYLATKT